MRIDDEVLVKVEHLDKSFTGAAGDTLLVLDDISLDLHAGEIVALLGRSGSGKSTLLRSIAGLIAPTSGSVRYRGAELNGANPGTAMVFQTFALMPWLTVQDNVELGLAARGVPPAERHGRALRAIDLIGLDGFESAYPKELSGGMRRRVSIARALITRPAIVLYDSPTAGLDPVTSQTIITLILRLRDVYGVTALLATHRLQDGFALANFHFDSETKRVVRNAENMSPAMAEAAAMTRFIVYKDGGIYFEGTPEELADSKDEYLKRFLV